MLGFFKQIFENKITLVKINMLNSLSSKVSELSFMFISLIIGIFFLIFLNLSLVFVVIELFNSFIYGFLVIALFYLIILILLFLLRKKITNKIQDVIIAKYSDTIFKS